ncbi:hypothetical protein [Desulforamulus reducens]|uniref:hypothetical protein n=1 Tax=Desulforamulus reducens TaxID=59610 RepID=UPI0002FEF87F|nr:hypothetical protein [Desulforamulus reducens]
MLKELKQFWQNDAGEGNILSALGLSIFALAAVSVVGAILWTSVKNLAIFKAKEIKNIAP